LVDKLASFKWDGSLDQADQFSKLIIELLSLYASQEAKIVSLQQANTQLEEKVKTLAEENDKGKKAIELVKECDEYLDSFYKINSIRTYCNLHIKMKELLQPDGLTKGERG